MANCTRPEWADDEKTGCNCPLDNPNAELDDCPEWCEWKAAEV